MKHFIFFSLTIIASIGFSQNLALPLDFEAVSSTYPFSDFVGGQTTVISNPQSTGSNPSLQVAQMIKSVGEPWGGSYLTLDNPIDFSAARTFTMKVFSPRVGARVLLKVEHLTDGAIYHQIEDTVSLANAWEELQFNMNFLDATQAYSKVVLIFDIGVMGDGSPNFTFLFDDIQLISTGPILAQTDLPVTFDDTTVAYALTDFEGAQSVFSLDPMNSNNMVAKTSKLMGAGSSSGTTMSTPGLGFANPIPITASETKMSVRVYVPDAGIPVRLKIEDVNDPTKSVETETLTTVANAWETLTFDFNNEAPGTAPLNLGYTFNMASIFFNFGTDGNTAGDKTYYWDDVHFGVVSTGILELEKMGFSYFPNPAQHHLNLRAAQPIDEVTLYNQMGQVVLHTKPGIVESVLDLSALSPQVYVMKVRIGQHLGSVRVITR